LINNHCNNCGIERQEPDVSLRPCATCGSDLCIVCWNQHAQWRQELRTTDRLINREIVINSRIASAFSLFFGDPPPRKKYSRKTHDVSSRKRNGENRDKKNSLDSLFW
jgi:hypothetical protein